MAPIAVAHLSSPPFNYMKSVPQACRYACLTRTLMGVLIGGLLVSPSAWAQSSNDESTQADELREAGDEATFRRIERFPEASDKTTSPPTTSSADALPAELRRAMAAEKWAEARRLVETSNVAAGSMLSGSDVDFLAGYIAYQQDRHRSAIAFFDQVLEATNPLRDYAAYYAAHGAFALDRLQDAIQYAARVPVASLQHGDALMLLGRALVEAGTESDVERARDVFEAHLDHYPDGPRRHDARFQLASVLLELGEWKSAAAHGRRVLREAPLSEAAGTMRERLQMHRDQLPESARKHLDDPSREMKLARFRALFDHHQSEHVIQEVPDVAEHWVDGSEDWCQAIYWVGRSHTKLREHEEAATWYERLLEECRGIDPFEKKALYLSGKGYWNIAQKEKALERFEDLWSAFSDHSYADDAMYFAARIHRELDNGDRARELVDKQVERYPTGDMASDAHWLLVRQMFGDEQYEAVVDYIDDLDRTGERHRYTQGRLAYIRALALQRSGDEEPARKGYREVIRRHPLGYYGLLAFNRLAALNEVDTSKVGEGLCGPPSGLACEEILGRSIADESESQDWKVPPDVRRKPSYRTGLAFLQMGLRQLAAREFRRLFDAVSDDDRALRGLAQLLDEAGAYPLSSTLPGRIGEWQSRYPESETRAYWTIAYPQPFRDTVDRWAQRHDIPEPIVYGIMRKESRYNPTVGSSAGAQGLMQLMPETARSVADEVGMTDFEVADLVDPAVNVRLGTSYLETLADKTGGHPTLMAASYNGGYGSVSSWTEVRGDLPLGLWVEDIPWGQTRRYAKMVTANYWVYEWLYGRQTVPNIPMRVSNTDRGD